MSTSALVPLRLVYRVDGRYVVFEETPSAELRQNLIQVIDFYGVPREEGQEGALLVPPEVAADLELIYNYIIKADDPDWLRDHPVTPRGSRPLG
jgi:hypothetical protein